MAAAAAVAAAAVAVKVEAEMESTHLNSFFSRCRSCRGDVGMEGGEWNGRSDLGKGMER